MAIAATAVWEMRTTGANTNGGFYKSDAGTTDYSQQASAQWTGTNISSDGSGTAITDDDAQGLFTAQMVGNGFKIETGGGFTEGWYEIVTFTDSNNVTIDRTAGAGASSGSGKVGGAVALPVDAMLESFTAGNILWIKAGTYTFTENVAVANDGTAANMMKVKGYNATRDDAPSEDNRPLFACGAFFFQVDDYWSVEHIRATGTGNPLLEVGDWSMFFNCKSVNSSGTANRTALRLASGTYGTMHDCEAVSTNGTPVRGESTSAKYLVAGCYVHDSNIAIDCEGGATIVNCIIDTIVADAIAGSSGVRYFILNNTIYNAADGIDLSNGVNNIILNNIISDCTNGITASSAVGTNYLDYNNFHNNGTDVNNVTKGPNTTSDDPEFTDAANGDFSNTLAQNAMPKTNFPGALTTNSMTQGAVQTSDGAGLGETSYGFVC